MIKCCGYKSIVFFVGALLLLFLGWYFLNNSEEEGAENLNNKNLETQNQEQSAIEVARNDGIESKEEVSEIAPEENPEGTKKPELPDKIKLIAPFTSQAPYAVWDEIHEEACEEASLLMAAYYYRKKSLSPEIAEGEIQKMVKFQVENYGDFKDSDMKQLKQLAEDFFNLENGEIIENPSVEDLKNILAEEKLIIIPAAGRLLGNPYFTPPGPLYHNLVLIGYDDVRKIFITNDPGTKRGEGYEYDYEVLLNAIHDFPGKKSEIEKGEKRVLIF